MRRRSMLWAAVWAMLAVVPATAGAADEFILTAPESEALSLAARQGLTVLQRIDGRDVFLVRGPAGVPAEVVIARVLADPELDDEHDKIAIELNAVVHLPEGGLAAPLYRSTVDAERALLNRTAIDYHGSPVWVRYARQPASVKIRSAEAHAAFGLGAGIVAVIDSGVDLQHPALETGLVEGFDFTRDRPGGDERADVDASHPILNPLEIAILDNDTVVPINHATQALLDPAQAAALAGAATPATFGHGTMVASLIRLVAPRAMVMPLKAFDGAGVGRLFDIVRALYYARDHGAKVVNLSLSMAAPSRALSDALRFLDNEKVFVVAAAGNTGSLTPRYPAAEPTAIAVASITAAGRRSTFSNAGPFVRLAAPGEAVIAAYPGGQYALAWGTSFATPLVAGAIALMHEVKPGINWDEVTRALAQADVLADPALGAGRLNVPRAVADAYGIVWP